MYRHISIFTLKNKNEINRLVELLNEVGKCTFIVNNHIGLNITDNPNDGKGPDFGDVIQMIDFATQEDLDAYPHSKEHLKLFHEGPEMIKVTAIDYQIDNL